MASLIDVLDVEARGGDVFVGPSSGLMEHLFGGHLLGQSVVAAGRTVEDRAVNSLHGYFLLAGDGRRPIQYEVERTRDGGSFSSRRVIGSQDGRVIWVADVSFHRGAKGFERAEDAPDAKAPEELPSFMEGMRSSMGAGSEWEDFEVRWGGPWPPNGEAPANHPARNYFWFRTSLDVAEDPVMNAAVLAYISDLTFLTPVLLPHRAFMWTPGLHVTSLDHAIWFHRPFSVNEWLLYDQRSPIASNGRGLALGSISAPDRGRVVSTAQEGLVRIQS